MYGMIHRALQAMVVEEFGPEAWDAVSMAAKVGPAELVSAVVYPDEVTLRIIQASAFRSGRAEEEFLRRFGAFWVRFAEQCPYGDIMDFTGRDIRTFIGNLDRMHFAVVDLMPGAKVPSFALTEDTRDQLRVRYRSPRTGLEAMVLGLLEGLLDRFGIEGEVTAVAGINEGAEFLINLAVEGSEC